MGHSLRKAVRTGKSDPRQTHTPHIVEVEGGLTKPTEAPVFPAGSVSVLLGFDGALAQFSMVNPYSFGNEDCSY